MEQIVNRFRICGLCNNQKIRPRRLMCLHSFCEKCVETHLQSFIGRVSYPCPVCSYIIFPINNNVVVSRQDFYNLRPDKMNGDLWDSFEFNRCVSGQLKFKKLCSVHDLKTREFLCYDCGTTFCLHGREQHDQCHSERLLDRKFIANHARNEVDKSLRKTDETFTVLDSFRKTILSKTTNLASEKKSFEEKIKEYFSNLKQCVHGNMQENEQAEIATIDGLVDKRTDNDVTSSNIWEVQLSNLQNKFKLLKYLYNEKGSAELDLTVQGTVLPLCIDIEKILESVEINLVSVIGQEKEHDLNEMLYFDRCIEEHVASSKLIDIELLKSYYSEPVSSFLEPADLASSTEVQKHIAEEEKQPKMKDDMHASSSAYRPHRSKYLADQQAAYRRRCLRTMSIRQDQVASLAFPIRSSVRSRPQLATTASVSVFDEMFRKFTFISNCNINYSKDLREPDIGGIACIGDYKVLVADRWNKAIKLFHRPAGDDFLCQTTFILDFEPWDVSELPDNECIVACPRMKTLVVLKVRTELVFVESIKVRIGYGSVSHLKSDDKLVCSVCPGNGDPQVNTLNREGRILQVIMLNENNECIFSYPRYLSSSSSEFVVTVDLKRNSVLFLRIGEISSSVVSEFKGHGDLKEPKAAAVEPNTDSVIVVFMSGSLALFSVSGQLMGVIQGKISRDYPKCLAVSESCLCVGHMNNLLTLYKLH